MREIAPRTAYPTRSGRHRRNWERERAGDQAEPGPDRAADLLGDGGHLTHWHGPSS
jgi:hypothetical protein